MRRLLVLAALGACTPPMPPGPAAPPTVVTPRGEAAALGTTEPPPAPAPLTLEELREEEANLLEYPPTACVVKQLVGERFPALEARGGYYPGGELEDAVAYQGALCPQPGCDRGLTWFRPDGAVVVALEDGTSTTIFTNRRALTTAPPSPVLAFLEEGAKYGDGQITWRVRSTETCRGLEEETQAYRATKERRACDPRFAHFWDWAAVRLTGGEAVPFFDEPGTRSSKVAAGGALVALGHGHADDDRWVCSELRMAGARTVGYLRRTDLVSLDERPPPSSPVARAPRPAWLGATPTRHGDLKLTLDAGPPAKLEIALQRVMAGHICEAQGTLEELAPRLFGGGTVGCDVHALVLVNGVYLWENGDCSGARATCAGGYW